MNKDNEVDEKVMPVAWIVTNGGESCEPWLEYEQSEVDALPAVCIAEPLYSAATVAELRAEVERRKDALDSCREAGNKHVQRRCQMDDEIERLTGEKTAAERRVGELEALLGALRPYAQHDDACGDMDAYNNATIESCGCGLDSLLDAAAPAASGAHPDALPDGTLSKSTAKRVEVLAAASVSERARALMAQAYRDGGYPHAAGTLEAGVIDSVDSCALRAIEQALTRQRVAASYDAGMAMHWIERYAAGIDEECQLDRITEALTTPQPSASGYLPNDVGVAGLSVNEILPALERLRLRLFRHMDGAMTRKSQNNINDEITAVEHAITFFKRQGAGT